MRWQIIWQKNGAKNGKGTIAISNFKVSSKEICSVLKQFANKSIKEYESGFLPFNQTRKISNIVFRLRLNAWATKYTKNIHCVCSTDAFISVQHILYDCPVLKELYTQNNISAHEDMNLKTLLQSEMLLKYIDVLFKTSIGRYL